MVRVASWEKVALWIHAKRRGNSSKHTFYLCVKGTVLCWGDVPTRSMVADSLAKKTSHHRLRVGPICISAWNGNA